MSAIRMTCPDCGAVYFAGMVGSTPWPAHVCDIGNPPSADWEHTPHAFAKKLGVREGEAGYDGDPESCALCHFTAGNPVHTGACLYCDGDRELETTEMHEYVPCKFCAALSASRSESETRERPLRLDVEDLLTARGWKPVERILGRRVNVFFEHPDFKGTFGASAAIQAQMRREEKP